MCFLHFTACIVTYVKSHYSPSLIISSNIPCKAGLGEHFFHRDAEKIGVFGSLALSGVTGLAKGNKHASLRACANRRVVNVSIGAEEAT